MSSDRPQTTDPFAPAPEGMVRYINSLKSAKEPESDVQDDKPTAQTTLFPELKSDFYSGKSTGWRPKADNVII